MKPRERFINALERKPIKGRVPHFELVFYLTMEHLAKFTHPIEIILNGNRYQKRKGIYIEGIWQKFL